MASHVHRFPISPALCIIAVALLGLTGCEGQKVIARVKSDPIMENEFQERVQRVTNQQLAAYGNLDAGGATLISMIRERLVSRLAKDKNVIPTKEDVQRFTNYSRRLNPSLEELIKNGQITESDIARQAQTQMEEFAIGTDGAKVEEKDLQAAYETEKSRLKAPEMYTLRSLPFTDEVTANQALEQLKKNPDFKAAATQFLASQPALAATAGREATVPATEMPPALIDALKSVSAGQFAPKPVPLQSQNSQTGMATTVYLVTQLVKKEPEYTPSAAEIRPILTRVVLSKTHPQWNEHKNQELAKFTADIVTSNDVQINIKRYQTQLLPIIRMQAEAALASGGMAVPGGAPLGGGAPPPSAPPSSPPPAPAPATR